ncbi:MAG: MBL fold metallo-hydrolase [Bacteroidota bacterium]
MPNYICTTCGTQYAATEQPPETCAICADERQYINPNGQQWTTLEQLRNTHKAVIKKIESGLYGINSTPGIGIGQRPLLVQTEEGNLLWDCTAFIDEALVDIINSMGGLKGIAISHPHFYTSMVEWSQAFGDIPIYLHERDRQWVQRNHPNIVHWSGERKSLFGGLSIHHVGGHFDGSSLLHWPDGAGGRGALMTGDTIQVVHDLSHISFMYSFPNQIPLSAETVKRIATQVDKLAFDRIYGAWWGRIIQHDAKEAVRRSARRYIAALQKKR